MSAHTVLNIPAFRAVFTAFANTTKYPDATLNMFYANAGTYISQNDSYSGGLCGPSLDLALQLMTAHILASFALIARGQTSVIVAGSTIDKVTVSLSPPPVKDAWQFWLSTTPYGLQLLAMLQVKSAGGWMVGGSPERQAFRKAGGRF